MKLCHLEIIPHDQRQLPDAGIGLGGARRDHAVMENLKKNITFNIRKNIYDSRHLTSIMASGVVT